MPAIVRAAPAEVIEMRGTARGERVWFRPHGLAVAAGTTIRFINHDPGNSHTATAYHPDNFDRTRRIPKAAQPWNSDFLLPDESFEVTLTVPGVYDYYCIPHEMAAMVGRIVVGDPGDAGWEGPSTDTEDVSLEVFDALPMVEDILDLARIEQEGDT
ncbi:cupredoxin domain-containing protein [Primorskyibacter flagellatus]|uniref:cupredoxin domain-containing protein n=1 Tax=Primorskyibacter flagellatus TaxID=1387277 RepID=UPI003A8CA55B